VPRLRIIDAFAGMIDAVTIAHETNLQSYRRASSRGARGQPYQRLLDRRLSAPAAPSLNRTSSAVFANLCNRLTVSYATDGQMQQRTEFSTFSVTTRHAPKGE
jgi:hypothetical protein